MADPKRAKVTTPPGASLPKSIRFKYLFPDDYSPQYANGAHGSVTPQGELTVNFYLERSPLPYSETHAVTSSGEVGEEIRKVPALPSDEALVLRQLTSGVVMNVATATRVYEMLGRLLTMVVPTAPQQERVKK
jgi:hypothetical protein